MPIEDETETTAIARRDFLVGGAALLATAGCLPGVDGRWEDEGSALCSTAEGRVEALDPARAGRVVELHDPALLSGTRVSQTAAAPALERLLLALTGAADLRAAWRALVPTYRSGEVIGIKVNMLGDRVPTHGELIRALVGLIGAGMQLPADRILVWDRRLDEFADARISSEQLGCPIEGTWQTAADVGEGRGYELESVCIGGRKTHLSNILTRRIDHLINFAVMKNHKASGFTGCLKNNYGVINNPGDYHDIKVGEQVVERRFERAIPGVNALDEVTRKTRLWLMDAVVGVCRGDTSDPPDCFPARLLASLDPVAIDARGRQIRDEQRGELGPSPETVSQGWLAAAERAGLGVTSAKVQEVA